MSEPSPALTKETSKGLHLAALPRRTSGSVSPPMGVKSDAVSVTARAISRRRAASNTPPMMPPLSVGEAQHFLAPLARANVGGKSALLSPKEKLDSSAMLVKNPDSVLLEQLLLREREAKKAAKLHAAKELAATLSSPDDLVKVEQLQQNEARRISKAQLNTLVKGKLESVGEGLDNIESAGDYLEQMRDDFHALNSLSKDVSVLVPLRHYELIQEVNVARSNLMLTRMHLENIISVPYAVDSTRALMMDDINLLDVHGEVRRLQKIRAKILDSAHKHPHQQQELAAALHNVVDLASSFDKKLEDLLANHLELAFERPAVLIKALQVINREKKMREVRKTRKRERELREKDKGTFLKKGGDVGSSANSAASSSVPEIRVSSNESASAPFAIGTIIKEAEDSAFEHDGEVKDYFVASKEWISAAVLAHFHSLFTDCKDAISGEYIVADFLAKAKDVLVTDLTRVYDDVRPCFPPAYDIFNVYCSMYHACFNQIFIVWAEKGDVPPDETLNIVRWINTFYKKQMLRMGANEDFLRPDLTESLRPLLESYKTAAKEQIGELAMRIIEQDRDDTSKLLKDDLYFTTGPVNLFRLMHARLDSAKATSSNLLLFLTAEQCFAVIKDYQARFDEILTQEGNALDFGYLLALINNFSKSYEYMDEMAEKLGNLDAPYSVAQLPLDDLKMGWQRLLKHARTLVIDAMLAVLAQEFEHLYSADWLGSTTIVRTIIDTLNEYFEEDIGSHIIPTYAKKLAVECFEKIVTQYVRAMFVKKHTFKKESADRLDEDISELTVFFRDKHNVRDKVSAKITDIIQQLGKILRTRDPRQLKAVIQALQKSNPDVTVTLIEHLIKARDDLDSDDTKEFVGVARQAFSEWQAPDEISQGHFSGLKPVSGGIFKASGLREVVRDQGLKLNLKL